MPTLKFHLPDAQVEIVCTIEKTEIHRINIPTIVSEFFGIRGISVAEVGVDATILKQSEVLDEHSQFTEYGVGEFFNSIENTKPALKSLPLTLGLNIYLPDKAFDLLWSKVITRDHTNMNIVLSLADNTSSINEPWDIELESHLPIEWVRIEYISENSANSSTV